MPSTESRHFACVPLVCRLERREVRCTAAIIAGRVASSWCLHAQPQLLRKIPTFRELVVRFFFSYSHISLLALISSQHDLPFQNQTVKGGLPSRLETNFYHPTSNKGTSDRVLVYEEDDGLSAYSFKIPYARIVKL